MKAILSIGLLFASIAASADIPDLTGNYTGCGISSSLGKHQAVLVIVKMPTGFGKDDFRYTGGFYWFGAGATGADFFTDIQIDEPSSRFLMRAEIKPLHDFGVIAKTIMAHILPDGSIEGELLMNATDSEGEFQHGTWTVRRVQASSIPSLNCAR